MLLEMFGDPLATLPAPPLGHQRGDLEDEALDLAAHQFTELMGTTHDGSFSSESDVPLKDYLGRWLEESVRDSVRPRTWERHEKILSPELGNIRLDKPTPAQVQGLYRRELDSGISPRTG